MKSSRSVQVFLIPTSGDCFKGAFAMILSGANAFHAGCQTTRLGGHAEPRSLARKLDAVNNNFEAACTSSPVQCGRNGVKWACRRPLERQIFSRYGCWVRFSDRSDEREDRQSVNSARDESLDKALRRGADTAAHSNKLVSRLGPPVIGCARPNFYAEVPGMVLDPHLPEDWAMSADPFRKLRDSHIHVSG